MLSTDHTTGTSRQERGASHDTAVLIGRFQPFHAGHAALLQCALEVGRRVVLVLGSAHAARSPRNPFTAAEREEMIRSTLTDSDNARLVVLGQRDVWCSERWARQVREAVGRVASGRIALVGFRKDATSEYLRMFPDWDWIDTGRQGPLDATPLRQRLLGFERLEPVLGTFRDSLAPSILDWLSRWGASPVREELAQETAVTLADSARWGDGPFVTVDALVRFQGRVLLVRRAKRPGRGLLALPGCFLDPGEVHEAAALRVLRQEAGLALDGILAERELVFSHPNRSQRARIVTHAFLFEPAWDNFPALQAGDGIESAVWIPESDLLSLEDQLFEDHFHILSGFLPALPG